MKQLFWCAALAAGLVGCWSAETPQTFVRPVKLVATKSLASYDKDFVGVVTAQQYTDLAFQVSGLISKTYVNEGSFVKKGQVLAQIDPADIRLQMEADRAQFQTTRSILERTERLLQKQAISVQDAEIARSNFTKAQSQYEYSKNQYGYASLKAPFSGNIEKKYVENFQKVNAGEAIYKLINPDVLEVGFTLPESDVNIIALENKYYVEFENFREELFEAKIKEVVDASVDGAGIPVTLAITDKRFKPEKYNIKAGFACRVRVVIDNGKALMHLVSIPLSAVYQPQGATESSVWVYNPQQGVVQSRKVHLAGLSGANHIIVRQGLSAGERIVSAGVYQLTENQKVTVLE